MRFDVNTLIQRLNNYISFGVTAIVLIIGFLALFGNK